MKTITMVEFRQNAPAILRGLRRSGEILITHRGKPAAKLSPPDEKEKMDDFGEDLWSKLLNVSVEGSEDDATMTNEKIDQVLYGYGRACDP